MPSSSRADRPGQKKDQSSGLGIQLYGLSITTINHWQGSNSPHAKLTGIIRMQTGLRMEYVNLHSFEISVLDYYLTYICILFLLILSSKLRCLFLKDYDHISYYYLMFKFTETNTDLTQWTYFCFCMCNRDNIL